MMADYIPSSDEDKIVWLTQFTNWLVAHGGTYGFNTGDLTAMQDATNTATTSFTAHETAQATARAATAQKNNDIGAAIALARQDAQRLQTNPAMDDFARGEAGLTIPDDIKTASSEDAIKEITPPMIHLDFSIRHQVTVHWGPNPANENKNGKPAGVLGCEIQFVKNEEPADENAWFSLGMDTDSPLLHEVHETTPTTYIYRGRYVDKKLRSGAFGDPVKCTVSV